MAAKKRRRHHLTAHQRRARAARKAARTRARRYGHSGHRARRAVARFGTNPRRYRYRKNPRRSGASGALAGFGTKRGVIKLATGAGVGMLGAVALDYLWQYGSRYLPAQAQSGYLGTAAKAGTAVLGGWLASKVIGRPAAIAGTLGALTVIGYQLVHQMIAANAPQAAIPATTTAATPALAGMDAYMNRGLGWVSPGTPLALRGLRGLNAYMPGGGVRMPAAMARPGGSVSPSGLAMAGGY